MASNAQNRKKVLDSAARKAVTSRAQKVLPVAKSKAGAEAPSLGMAVKGNTQQDVSARVGSSDPKFVYYEKGVAPHVIRPKNGKTLVFPGLGGGKQHATVVYHPGQPGRHPLQNALEQVIK